MYNMPDLYQLLTWERIRTLNIGLTWVSRNDELTIGFDWFQRETGDMPAPRQVLPNTWVLLLLMKMPAIYVHVDGS